MAKLAEIRLEWRDNFMGKFGYRFGRADRYGDRKTLCLDELARALRPFGVPRLLSDGRPSAIILSMHDTPGPDRLSVEIRTIVEEDYYGGKTSIPEIWVGGRWFSYEELDWYLDRLKKHEKLYLAVHYEE